MSQGQGSGSADSSVDALASRLQRALRRTRGDRYAVDTSDGRLRICLTVQASPAGRRNVAVHIVAALAQQGLGLEADDPVESLIAPEAWCEVVPADTPGTTSR